MPRRPRHASGHQRPRGRPSRENGARPPLRDTGRHALPPQTLFLRRPAEGLPDNAVRARDSAGRLPRRHSRRQAEAHPPRPPAPRRRRRKARPPDRRRTPLGRGLLARRLQPRRYAALRNSLDARHELARRGDSLRHADTPARALPRRLRRRNGVRLAARRRQRLAMQPRRLLRHARRAQEHKLAEIDRTRARIRNRAPEPRARRGRDACAGDTPLGRRGGRHALDAQQRGRARLPLLRRDGPRTDRREARLRGAHPRVAARDAVGQARPLHGAVRPLARGKPANHRAARNGRLLRRNGEGRSARRESSELGAHGSPAHTPRRAARHHAVPDSRKRARHAHSEGGEARPLQHAGERRARRDVRRKALARSRDEEMRSRRRTHDRRRARRRHRQGIRRAARSCRND